jgi:filamentous hemagglutinin
VGAAFGPNFNIGRFLSETAMGCAGAKIMGGDCSGGAKLAAALSLLSWGAHVMRENQLQSSGKFKQVCDPGSGDCRNNLSGKSAGIDGDDKKLAGTRIDRDGLEQYGTVTDRPDGGWNYTANKNVINPDTKKPFTLLQALGRQGGLTGGSQSGQGTLAGVPYSPDGFADKLLESYSGTHDWLDSPWMYDNLGNIEQGRSEIEAMFDEVIPAVNLIPATFFAIPTLLRQYGIYNAALLWDRVHADIKKVQKQ